jgi:hypothetical protein
MTNLYREKDLKIIDDNIDDITDKARMSEITLLDPKLKEYKEAMKFLEDFVSKKNRVIYGGWAWHKLIEHKNKDDGIYDKNRTGYPDIEFYSPEPVKDLIEICNGLHEKGFKYVQGREAEHPETYSLFANFVNYCDISYIPKIVVNTMSYITIDKIRYTHPKFILIDILRMYTDPLTSYWRVKKNMMRANKLLTYWPLETNGKFTRFNTSKNNHVLEYIRKNIIPGSNTIVFGYYAYQYYKYKGTDSQGKLYVPYYDVISSDLNNDASTIYKKLQEFDPNITVKEFHPYFQFLDRHVSFISNGRTVLNIYGNYNKCIPYKFLEKKNINICSFQIMVLFMLSQYFYCTTYRNTVEAKNYDFMLEDIINIRNDYLKKNKKTIFDNTPFEEFIIQCQGKGHNPKREWMLGVKEKKKLKKRVRFTYDPSSSFSKNIDPSKHFFKNTSGNVNNSKMKILNV